MINRLKRYVLLTVIFAFTVYGCSGRQVKPGSLEDMDAPEWTMKGSGTFHEDNSSVFYGVGSASGIRNYSLLRETADNRARAELAKVFNLYTASLMKDYEASTTAGDFDKSSEEQHVEQAIKTVAAETLSGVEIVNHWEHPSKNEMFSLARLDLNKFKDNLDRMQELSKRVREYVRKNAEKLHDELAKEEEKMKEE